MAKSLGWQAQSKGYSSYTIIVTTSGQQSVDLSGFPRNKDPFLLLASKEPLWRGEILTHAQIHDWHL